MQFESLSDGPSFEQSIDILAKRGDFGPLASTDEAVRALTSSLASPYVDERMLADGRILKCRRDEAPLARLIASVRT